MVYRVHNIRTERVLRPIIISNYFFLANSYFPIVYYYSDKELKYRIPYQ